MCAPFIFLAAAILLFPQKYVPACLEGFTIWAESVLPSLFPFMVISGFLIKTGAADCAAAPLKRICGRVHLPESAAPLFALSAISGYPAGSKMVSEYCSLGYVSKDDCRVLAPLCSTAGPLFIVGTVGFKAFGGGSAGVKLLFACITSVLSTTVLYALPKRKGANARREIKPIAPKGDALYDSFYGAVTAVCLAGGYIAFFHTLAVALQGLGLFAPLIYALSPLFGEETAAAVCSGLCEATGGCFALAGAGGFFALPLAGFLITFGGASIIAQQSGYLGKCGVSAGYFTLFKFVQGIVCFCLLCLISLL